MKKNMLVFLLLSIVMCLLAGCNRPVLMSMGTAPLPVYHEPRWSGEQDKNWVVSGDVFVGPYGEGLNIREVFSMGGDLSVMYRFMNPLFVQASFAGAMGDLRFACSDTPCTSRYYSWRDKHDEKYVFWTLQERVLLGSDFVFGGIVQAGFGMGVQFYHADGQYESAREDLEDSDIADNVNGRNEIYPVLGSWLGFNLGRHARHGVIKNETYLVMSNDLPQGGVMTGGINYYHPSGFHGGFSYSAQMGIMFQAGKSFSF